MNNDTMNDSRVYRKILLYGIFIRSVSAMEAMERAGITAQERMGFQSIEEALERHSSDRLAPWFDDLEIDSYGGYRWIYLSSL